MPLKCLYAPTLSVNMQKSPHCDVCQIFTCVCVCAPTHGIFKTFGIGAFPFRFARSSLLSNSPKLSRSGAARRLYSVSSILCVCVYMYMYVNTLFPQNQGLVDPPQKARGHVTTRPSKIHITSKIVLTTTG